MRIELTRADVWVDDNGVLVVDVAKLPADTPLETEIAIIDVTDPDDPIAVALQRGLVAVAKRN